MILFIPILSILLYSLKQGKSIATLLCILYVCSLVGLFLMSPAHFFKFNLNLWNILFLLYFYFMLLTPWMRFKLARPIDLRCSSVEYKIYKFYKYSGIVCFLLNIIVFYILSKVVTDYSAYKNFGERSDAISYLPISNNMLLLLTWYSYTYLLMLPFHFYFLSNGNLKEGIISFLLSGNFVLSGLTSFSRSSSVSFVILYIILFLYFKKNFDIRLAKRMKYIIVISAIGLVFSFYSITMNRFGGDNEYVNDSFVYNDAILNNKILNSQLSYFSEWYIHTNKWLPMYNDNALTNGSRTFPIIGMFLSKFNITKKYPDYMNKIMWNQFGNDQFTFLGIATCSVFDLSLLLTCVLIFVYYLIVRDCKLIFKNVGMIDMMLLILLIQIPATGLFNSVLNTIGWHISLFLYICFLLFKKLQARRLLTNNNDFSQN